MPPEAEQLRAPTAADVESTPKVQPPRDLSARERAYWSELAPLLASARALAPADRHTLADYCRACAAVVDRERRLTRELRKRQIDRILVKMLDAQLRGWISEKTRLAGELGLTAIARMKIKWTGHPQRLSAPATPEKPQSKLAQLQEQAVSLCRPVGVK
jgi:phage terminase small subunit